MQPESKGKITIKILSFAKCRFYSIFSRQLKCITNFADNTMNHITIPESYITLL